MGGTSLGAPAWAGLIAIADQGRALVGKGSLDGPSQTLPALYAAASTDYNTVTKRALIPRTAADSRSVVLNRSADCPTTSFLESVSGFGSGMTGVTTTGATANTSTGLGSPKGASIVTDLVSTNLTTPVSTGEGSGQAGTAAVRDPDQADR